MKNPYFSKLHFTPVKMLTSYCQSAKGHLKRPLLALLPRRGRAQCVAGPPGLLSKVFAHEIRATEFDMLG